MCLWTTAVNQASCRCRGNVTLQNSSKMTWCLPSGIPRRAWDRKYKRYSGMFLLSLTPSAARGMNPSWGVLSSRWQRIKLVFSQQAKEGDTLDSVVPGEVTEVQLRAKCASNPAAGHWSRWSEPVRAMVPQSSGGERGEENICNPAAGQTWWFKRVGFVVQVIFHWCASPLTCSTSPACGTRPDTGQTMTSHFSTRRVRGTLFIASALPKWDNKSTNPLTFRWVTPSWSQNFCYSGFSQWGFELVRLGRVSDRGEPDRPLPLPGSRVCEIQG